jgi:hypothetical protein
MMMGLVSVWHLTPLPLLSKLFIASPNWALFLAPSKYLPLQLTVDKQQGN